MITSVITRLKDQVAAFGSRVEGLAELAALVREGAMPQVTPAAFVVPLGLKGGTADAAAGLYRLQVEEVIGVVIVAEAGGDVTGAPALPTIDSLKDATIAAIAGWTPGDVWGVFNIARGQLVSAQRGFIIYQLDFAISDQVRIAT